MFRASSARLQEANDVNCTCMQPLVFSFSAGRRLVQLLFLHVLLSQMAALFLYNFILCTTAQDGHLQRMRIPEAAYMYS